MTAEVSTTYHHSTLRLQILHSINSKIGVIISSVFLLVFFATLIGVIQYFMDGLSFGASVQSTRCSDTMSTQAYNLVTPIPFTIFTGQRLTIERLGNCDALRMWHQTVAVARCSDVTVAMVLTYVVSQSDD
jgi:hypothetical protein